jgi:hypothetical protein
MKTAEIIAITDFYEYERFIGNTRLGFLHSLLEECWLLRQRIEHEKCGTTAMLAETAWFDQAEAGPRAWRQEIGAVMADLELTLDGLSKLDHVLSDLAILIGKDEAPTKAIRPGMFNDAP